MQRTEPLPDKARRQLVQALDTIEEITESRPGYELAEKLVRDAHDAIGRTVRGDHGYGYADNPKNVRELLPGEEELVEGWT